MTFTGLSLHYAIQDLQADLPARIQKIQQLSYGQLIFQMKKTTPFTVYLDITSQHARMHRTHLSFPHTTGPSMLTQRMKKWFLNAKCVALTQHGLDRVVKMTIEGINELFEPTTYWMYVEFFGKDANIIITDASDRILDLHKTTGSIFDHLRVLHIGATYAYPPSAKASPFDAAAIQAYLANPTGPVYTVFEGFSKPLGEAFISHAQTEKTWLETLQNPVFKAAASADIFSPSQPSLAFVQWADFHLQKVFEKTPYDQTLKTVQKILEKKKTKALKKHTALQHQMTQVKEAEAYTKAGTLLMQVADKHQKVATVEVFDYTLNEPVTLVVDPKRSVLANANERFKKAKKLKASIPHIKKQLRLNEKLIAYLDSILDQLSYADAVSLDDIYSELISEKIIRLARPKKPSRRSKPKHFIHQGTSIYVGQNHTQNAELTHRFAHATWWFLHVKNSPGSHVIIAHDAPLETTKEVAAMLAAYYSKARHHPKVNVDLVRVKDVKTVKGHKGHFVTYANEMTLTVPADLPDVKEKKAST